MKLDKLSGSTPPSHQTGAVDSPDVTTTPRSPGRARQPSGDLDGGGRISPTTGSSLRPRVSLGLRKTDVIAGTSAGIAPSAVSKAFKLDEKKFREQSSVVEKRLIGMPAPIREMIESGCADNFQALGAQLDPGSLMTVKILAAQVGKLAGPLRAKPGTVALPYVKSECQRLASSMKRLTAVLQAPAAYEEVMAGKVQGAAEIGQELLAMAGEFEHLHHSFGGIDMKSLSVEGEDVRKELYAFHEESRSLASAATSRFPEDKYPSGVEANSRCLADFCGALASLTKFDTYKRVLEFQDDESMKKKTTPGSKSEPPE